jgi:polyisoprenoid-binding protein YceI
MGKGSGTGSAAAVPSGPGAITPENTKIEFVGTKPNGKHNGGFKSFSGTVKPASADITTSTISVKIDTESIYTDADPKLGNHLRAPDFFDVKKFPEATFVSKEIKAEKKDDATHAITGDLTLHGTTKTITLPAKVTETADTLTIDSTITIDRTEFGIAFNPAQVNKEVTITVSAKVARK